MIAEGKYYARAHEWDLGVTENGKEQIAVRFRIEGGPADGQAIIWRGYFTEKTMVRTFESLRFCGWAGNNVGEIPVLPNLVQIVVSHEEYQGKTHPRVQWVNRIGGPVVKNQLEGSARADFAKRMQAAAMQVPTDLAAPGNEPAPPAAQSNGSGDDVPQGARDFEDGGFGADDIPF